MKTQTLAWLGLGLVLSLAPVASATDASNNPWSMWMENYYLNPDPDTVEPAIRALSASGDLDADGRTATAIGFLGAVFAANPDRVPGWREAFGVLPLRHRRLVAAALWYSGLPDGVSEVQAVSRTSHPGVRAAVDGMLAWERPSLAEAPVKSASSLNLQWGAFLATGESRYILNVLHALGEDPAGLGVTATRALAEKARAHPRVYDICRSEGIREPGLMPESLSTALNFSRPR